MKKIRLFFLMTFFLFTINIHAFDGNELNDFDLSRNIVFTDNFINENLGQLESITPRPQNSTVDEGFYWDNAMKARWAPFGILYNTRLYYRKALNRAANNFWHASSALEFGNFANKLKNFLNQARNNIYIPCLPSNGGMILCKMTKNMML